MSQLRARTPQGHESLQTKSPCTRIVFLFCLHSKGVLCIFVLVVTFKLIAQLSHSAVTARQAEGSKPANCAVRTQAFTWCDLAYGIKQLGK